MKVAFNPAPCSAAVVSYPLHLCDLIFVNEIEAAQLTSETSGHDRLAAAMAARFPESEIIVTLGKDGAVWRCGREEIFEPAVPVKAVMQTSKRTPEVFFKMSEVLGAEPAGTIVFEDALYAAVTAKMPDTPSSPSMTPAKKKR